MHAHSFAPSFKMIQYGPPMRPRWQVRLLTPYLFLVRHGLRWLGWLARRLGWAGLADWLAEQRARYLLRWYGWVDGDRRLVPWTHSARGR